MSGSIWKYNLRVVYCQQIQIPRGATPLTVQMQDGVPRLWCRVPDTEAPKDLVEINTIGTGWKMLVDPGQYIATVQIENLVWHYFLKTP
jgi:hypothetical protein